MNTLFRNEKMRKVQFTVLQPDDCSNCGLCCYGIGSPVKMFTYRYGHSGPYMFRPKDLPKELGDEIDSYFNSLTDGVEPLDHCLWFDEETGYCKHHQWRPQVCRDYETGCDACLNERKPYLISNPNTQPEV